jgi:hypothetical protein
MKTQQTLLDQIPAEQHGEINRLYRKINKCIQSSNKAILGAYLYLFVHWFFAQIICRK